MDSRWEPSSSQFLGSKPTLERSWTPPPQSLLKWRRSPLSSHQKSTTKRKKDRLFFLSSWPLESKHSASPEAKVSPVSPSSPYFFPFHSLTSLFLAAITEIFCEKKKIHVPNLFFYFLALPIAIDHWTMAAPP